MLSTIDENFEDTPEFLSMTTQNVLASFGFMVMVPENPDSDLFQVTEGFIQLMKLKQWTNDPHCLMRARIFEAVIKYLASQT